MPDLSRKLAVPIGVFDSGVGGLSVLRAIRDQLPGVPVIYFGDQGHVPYGPRPMEQVREFSEGATCFLLERGAKLIVVACNTASAAALRPLRVMFPEIPIVGMEPAVKPAAETTHSGVVGVLATPATFQGELYSSVVERFAQHVRILTSACPGLVQQIEAGALDSPETLRILHEALDPMVAEGIDTVVMGCTHYPFVIPQVQAIAGREVRVIDPSPAIARQIGRVLAEHGWLPEDGAVASVDYYTSGEASDLRRAVHDLLGWDVETNGVKWNGNRIVV
jgi:glutamate racemase